MLQIWVFKNEKARHLPGFCQQAGGLCANDESLGADVSGLLTLRAGGHVESDPLTFRDGLEACSLDCGEVGEEVFAAVFRCDESETLGIVEPFDCANCHVLNILKKIQVKG